MSSCNMQLSESVENTMCNGVELDFLSVATTEIARCSPCRYWLQYLVISASSRAVAIL